MWLLSADLPVMMIGSAAKSWKTWTFGNHLAPVHLTLPYLSSIEAIQAGSYATLELASAATEATTHIPCCLEASPSSVRC